MENWAKVKLGEVTRMLSGATPFKGNAAYWNGTIPWVSAKDMKRLYLYDAEDRITQEGLDNGSKLAPAGSTLILTRGMTLLNDVPICRVMKPLAFNQDVKALEPSARLDSQYLTYLLLALKPELLNMVEQAGHGTGKLPSELIKGIEVSLPELDDQRQIASILGALDDKIELNRRMNGTLEALAQAVFKEWFVEKAEEGWEEVTLRDACDIHDSKRVPLSNREREQRPGPYPYYGAASVMDYVNDYLFDGVHVLMGEDGSVVNPDGTPVLQYVWGKIWVNNHAHVLTGKGRISTEHLLLALREVQIAPYVTGAVQMKLNQGNLFKVPFLMPSEKACKSFNGIITPLYAKLRANVEESRTITALRDTLLPKLMRGEVKVKGPSQESLLSTNIGLQKM